MDLESLGWSPFFGEAFEAYREAGFVPLRVVAHQGNLYTAIGEDGEFSGRMRYECAQMGDFPAVGDWIVAKINPENGTMFIRAVLPRRTKFTRARLNKGAYVGEQVVSANVDVLFIVIGLDQDLSIGRIQRYVAQATPSGAEIVIVLNKSDLCKDTDEFVVSMKEVVGGVPVIISSAMTGEGLDEMLSHLERASTGSLVGISGVGKSTLINAILGDGQLKTGEVREHDSKGRHTTTHRQLIILPNGAMLIDNPGMRGMGLDGAEEAVSGMYEDVEAIMRQCKFRNCQHVTEPGCAIKDALASGTLSKDRYRSYLQFQKELLVRSYGKKYRSRIRSEVSRAMKRREESLKKMRNG